MIIIIDTYQIYTLYNNIRADWETEGLERGDIADDNVYDNTIWIITNVNYVARWKWRIAQYLFTTLALIIFTICIYIITIWLIALFSPDKLIMAVNRQIKRNLNFSGVMVTII